MFLQAVRYAICGLLRDRGLTAIVIVRLALGIGINATLFCIVDGVLIQPLPFMAADRLVVVNGTFERAGIRRGGISYDDLQDFKAAAAPLDGIAASATRSVAA